MQTSGVSVVISERHMIAAVGAATKVNCNSRRVSCVPNVMLVRLITSSKFPLEQADDPLVLLKIVYYVIIQ